MEIIKKILKTKNTNDTVILYDMELRGICPNNANLEELKGKAISVLSLFSCVPLAKDGHPHVYEIVISACACCEKPDVIFTCIQHSELVTKNKFIKSCIVCQLVKKYKQKLPKIIHPKGHLISV